ncbi:PREDICTED: uncharacterized protein LOC106746933 [Dinoponera quadriceps]|uniref:Uncharacterized protein LOC106746933 n=1 Tax=Dinoponera quadriceps TaxID=609295 RepID=A0A6P3XM84_DINQU|nr:PREDICTED: uncharacterized protein LOC106746933 [Dinoponera quadriceps]
MNIDPVFDSGSEGEFEDNVDADPDFEVTGIDYRSESCSDVDIDIYENPQPSTSSKLDYSSEYLGFKPRPNKKRKTLNRTVDLDLSLDEVDLRAQASNPRPPDVRPSDFEDDQPPTPIEIEQNKDKDSGDRPNKRKSKKQASTDEELEWTSVDKPPLLPVFDELSGITAAVDESSTPFQIFSLFFPESMIKLFKSETNKYAKSITDKLKGTNKLKKNSLWGKWVTVKLHEIYQFFSIIFHMCVVKKPKLRDYWSTDSFMKTSYAASVMPRD